MMEIRCADLLAISFGLCSIILTHGFESLSIPTAASRPHVVLKVNHNPIETSDTDWIQNQGSDKNAFISIAKVSPEGDSLSNFFGGVSVSKEIRGRDLTKEAEDLRSVVDFAGGLGYLNEAVLELEEKTDFVDVLSKAVEDGKLGQGTMSEEISTKEVAQKITGLPNLSDTKSWTQTQQAQHEETELSPPSATHENMQHVVVELQSQEAESFPQPATNENMQHVKCPNPQLSYLASLSVQENSEVQKMHLQSQISYLESLPGQSLSFSSMNAKETPKEAVEEVSSDDVSSAVAVIGIPSAEENREALEKATKSSPLKFVLNAEKDLLSAVVKKFPSGHRLSQFFGGSSFQKKIQNTETYIEENPDTPEDSNTDMGKERNLNDEIFNGAGARVFFAARQQEQLISEAEMGLLPQVRQTEKDVVEISRTQPSQIAPSFAIINAKKAQLLKMMLCMGILRATIRSNEIARKTDGVESVLWLEQDTYQIFNGAGARVFFAARQQEQLISEADRGLLPQEAAPTGDDFPEVPAAATVSSMVLTEELKTPVDTEDQGQAFAHSSPSAYGRPRVQRPHYYVPKVYSKSTAVTDIETPDDTDDQIEAESLAHPFLSSYGRPGMQRPLYYAKKIYSKSTATHDVETPDVTDDQIEAESLAHPFLPSYGRPGMQRPLYYAKKIYSKSTATHDVESKSGAAETKLIVPAATEEIEETQSTRTLSEIRSTVKKDAAKQPRASEQFIADYKLCLTHLEHLDTLLEQEHMDKTSPNLQEEEKPDLAELAIGVASKTVELVKILSMVFWSTSTISKESKSSSQTLSFTRAEPKIADYGKGNADSKKEVEKSTAVGSSSVTKQKKYGPNPVALIRANYFAPRVNYPPQAKVSAGTSVLLQPFALTQAGRFGHLLKRYQSELEDEIIDYVHTEASSPFQSHVSEHDKKVVELCDTLVSLSSGFKMPPVSLLSGRWIMLFKEECLHRLLFKEQIIECEINSMKERVLYKMNPVPALKMPIFKDASFEFEDSKEISYSGFGPYRGKAESNELVYLSKKLRIIKDLKDGKYTIYKRASFRLAT